MISFAAVPPSHLHYTVVGGGIIGLATARELLMRGVRHVQVVEAETDIGIHQTGHNSGVVHAGLYYRPGSLKARLCREGMRMTKEYCKQHNLPYRAVGKLVVALDSSQTPALYQLYKNALKNGVPDVTLLNSRAQVQDIEPVCGGIAAIHSPHTAIVDWRALAVCFADDIRGMSGKISLATRIQSLTPTSQSLTLHLRSKNDAMITLQTDRLITCAGVQSDRVARSLGGAVYPVIIPIRGEYLRLSCDSSVRPHLNIYPVPPPNKNGAPFLGVHFTPTLSGDVIVGPNAVPALAREGYSWSQISLTDIVDMLTCRGFWNLAVNHSKFALSEIRKSIFCIDAIREAIQYVPLLEPSNFERLEKANGVRAQAVARDGTLIDDFVFESVHQNRVLNVRNAPSPGATSSLAIARMIVDRSFGLTSC